MIIRNSVRCKLCKDEIESTYRHDFKWCSCGAIAVDGGHAYLARTGDLNAYEDTSVVETDGPTVGKEGSED